MKTTCVSSPLVTRRTAMIGLAAGSASMVSCSRNSDEVVMRPEGVPISSYDKKTTAEQAVATVDLKGKTVLITGATSGLGLESMRVLAARGARVLATGRSLDKARTACASIGPACAPLALELESMDSIRACADEVRKLDAPIDVLMCNAGIMALPQLEQVNGLEKQFAVNHLGHFLLVNLLLPQVLAAAQGRVVVMSSSAYKWAPPVGIEFDNLSGARDYTPNKAYGQSKTANGLFSLQLAKRMAGSLATSNSVNPGPVDTNLARHYPGWQRAILGVISGFILKPVAQGAATQCYVAADPALAKVSGHYFEDCNPRVPAGQMRNEELAAQLWQVSTDLCKGYLS